MGSQGSKRVQAAQTKGLLFRSIGGSHAECPDAGARFCKRRIDRNARYGRERVVDVDQRIGIAQPRRTLGIAPSRRSDRQRKRAEKARDQNEGTTSHRRAERKARL